MAEVWSVGSQDAAHQPRQQDHRGLGTSGDPFELSDDESVAAPAPLPCGLGTLHDPFELSDDESAAAAAPLPSPSRQQQLPQLQIGYGWLDAAGPVASCQSAARSAAFSHLLAHGADVNGKTCYVVHDLKTAFCALVASGIAGQDLKVPVQTTVETVGAMHCEGDGAMERAAGLLVQLERGGSTVLDDDGAVEPLDTEPFREDEEALQDLVDAKENGEDVDAALIKKKRKALGMRYTRARQALAAKALQRRVALLEIRVAELEEELRARAAA